MIHQFSIFLPYFPSSQQSLSFQPISSNPPTNLTNQTKSDWIVLSSSTTYNYFLSFCHSFLRYAVLYIFIYVYIYLMLGSFKLAFRYWRIKPQKLLRWREKGGLIEFVVYYEQLGVPVTIMMNDQVTFADLKNKFPFQSFEFILPKDIDPKRTISSILLEEIRPISIEVRSGTQNFSIRNQSRQIQNNIYARNVQNPKGLYKVFKINQLDIGQTKRILTNYYLKLQVQAFCKLNNHSPKTELTQTLKEEIFNYLNFCNESNSQENILFLQYEKEQTMGNLLQVKAKITSIQNRADRVLRWYQYGVIGLTSFHLVSFGYMIFGVEWLGWDIIQPLTYSVSVLSVLLGLRYYRKFNKDRNDDNLRDRFRSFVLKKHYRLQWNRLREKVKQDQQLLRGIDQKIKIERNRLAQISTITTLL